ncbi:hypothetical protein BOX15_Mlig010834g1 [Macrostomum lignano]|uniref:Uncharacterized protein n=1 Tax=Macrostomum lignano TaxID=282301 RepID=A0A267E4C7_9PLAT|nr:hypothetical protein BOX15_Mlig010834g1 [Macrostomum lignano]
MALRSSSLLRVLLLLSQTFSFAWPTDTSVRHCRTNSHWLRFNLISLELWPDPASISAPKASLTYTTVFKWSSLDDKTYLKLEHLPLPDPAEINGVYYFKLNQRQYRSVRRSLANLTVSYNSMSGQVNRYLEFPIEIGSQRFQNYWISIMYFSAFGGVCPLC